ncbi:hypothetical protein PIB30_048190 [Stylosanthes scabra]|uniref:Uncharacterized protein n=1 Tax=Stylosanthes scabra TaxID=79078 RepID=A0ABU6YIP6_9FABA|nr:hypothetical protein [Stylosanthes scabra]
MDFIDKDTVPNSRRLGCATSSGGDDLIEAGLHCSADSPASTVNGGEDGFFSSVMNDGDAANLFTKTIRNNPTSASDQVVSTRVGYRSQRGKGINQYFLTILQLDQTG